MRKHSANASFVVRLCIALVIVTAVPGMPASAEDPLDFMAIRDKVAKQLTRIVNSDFVEIIPGIWLPCKSITQTFAPPIATKAPGNIPAMTRQMDLRVWAVNQTPDNLFGLLAEHASSHTVPPAYHWKVMRLTVQGTEQHLEEGWMVRGVGRRIEIRTPGKDSKLLQVIVDTTESRFTRDMSRGEIERSPSLLEVPSAIEEVHVVHREQIDKWSEIGGAVFAVQSGNRGDMEVDKVTYTFPTDPNVGGDWPIHGWVRPDDLLYPVKVPFRTRVQWWDPTTGFALGKECGCKIKKHGTMTIDYPDPDSIPREYFDIHVQPK